MEKDKSGSHLLSLKKYGNNSLSYLTLSDDLSFFNGNWEGYIAYNKIFKTAVVLGNPIIPREDLLKAVKEFKNKFSSQNIHICFLGCTDQITNILLNQGFKGFLIGHEAIVDLNKFKYSGKKGWSIRSSINYAIKNKMTVEEYKFKEKKSLKIENELKRITNEWCKIKQMYELTFAFGHVDFNTFPDLRIFICKFQGRIVGFVVYFPIFGLQSYYLDLTRRELNSPRGVIDYLCVKSFEILKAEGIKKIYIGYSPVIYSLDSYLSSKLFMNFKPFLEFFYPSKSEFFFKNKYATDWEPNYFFWSPHISIRMLFALVHTIYGGGLASIFLNKIKHSLD